MSVVCLDYKVKTPVEWENKGLLANVGMSNGQVGGN